MVPAIIGAVFGVLLFCVILFFTYPWKIHPSSEYREADYELPGNDPAVPSLKDTFRDRFLIGTAITTKQVDDPETAKLIVKNFNIVTAEYQMKPIFLNPEPGVFDFRDADRIVDFCLANGILVHGHTLNWYMQVPEWWFKGSGKDGEATKEELLDRMHTYITTVVSHYKGKVYEWDVVNEAIEDNGKPRENGYYKILGDSENGWFDYLRKCFIWAREADPDVRLMYNEFHNEYALRKARVQYRMLETLMKEGVKVDGVGYQMHLENYPWPSRLLAEWEMKKCLRLRKYNPKFTISVTEMDQSVWSPSERKKLKKNDFQTDRKITARSAEKIARRWAEFFELYRRAGVSSVAVWGVDDGMSWINTKTKKDYALLFDRKLIPKPEFYAVLNPKHANKAAKSFEKRYKEE